MFFTKEAVLQIANNLTFLLNGETLEFIRKIVLAVLDPIQNLPLGILCFGENSLSLDA